MAACQWCPHDAGANYFAFTFDLAPCTCRLGWASAVGMPAPKAASTSKTCCWRRPRTFCLEEKLITSMTCIKLNNSKLLNGCQMVQGLAKKFIDGMKWTHLIKICTMMMRKWSLMMPSLFEVYPSIFYFWVFFYFLCSIQVLHWRLRHMRQRPIFRPLPYHQTYAYVDVILEMTKI